MNNNAERTNSQTLKIILTGEASVGKSSIVSKYVKGVFPNNINPTIVVEFGTKLVPVKDGSQQKVQIWDTAGQEKYKSIISQKAFGALLVYDVTRRETFEGLQRFLYELRQYAEPDCIIYLIGNKIDLVADNPNARQVSMKEAKAFAQEQGLKFLETSALSNIKITEAFENLVNDVYEQHKKPISQNGAIFIERNPETAKQNSCC